MHGRAAVLYIPWWDPADLLMCDLCRRRPDDKVAKTEKVVNGEEKPDSGVETQTSEGPAEEEGDPLGPNCYYDKTKSFFDNISCDDTR